MKTTNIIVDTNANGVEMTDCGTHWAITKPIANPKPNAPVCNIYHVGSQYHVQRMWNKRYANPTGHR